VAGLVSHVVKHADWMRSIVSFSDLRTVSEAKDEMSINETKRQIRRSNSIGCIYGGLEKDMVSIVLMEETTSNLLIPLFKQPKKV
jgi:hypothetical protein